MKNFLVGLVIFTSFSFLNSADPTFELENLTSKQIYVAIGNEANDPSKFKFDPVGAGDVITQYIDINNPYRTWILVTNERPLSGVKILSVKFKPKKKIFISVDVEGSFIRVFPQKKDANKSSLFTSKNARGYSLSGNVTKDDLEQKFTTYDTSNLSKEYIATLNLIKQRQEEEKAKKLAEEKKLEDAKKAKEAQAAKEREEKARLDKLRKEADLKKREEERKAEELEHLKQKERDEKAKLDAFKKQQEELARLKEVEIEKQKKAEEEKRIADEKAARDRQLAIEAQDRKLKEEQLRIEQELAETKRLEEIRTREAQEKKQLEEQARIEAEKREAFWKEKFEQDRVAAEEREKQSRLAIEESKKRIEEQDSKMRSEREAEEAAKKEEERKKIEDVIVSVRNTDPKDIYFEIIHRRLPQNPKPSEILNISIESLKIKENPLNNLDVLYNTFLNAVDKWASSERKIHINNILGTTLVDEKVKVAKKMITDAYEEIKKELVKFIGRAPVKYDMYSILGLREALDAKKDFLKILGISKQNPTFGELLILLSAKKAMINSASLSRAAIQRDVILARALLIDAYESAVNWLVAQRAVKNPYKELGLTIAKYQETPQQILKLNDNYTQDDVDKAYSNIKKSASGRSDKTRTAIMELVDAARDLAKTKFQ